MNDLVNDLSLTSLTKPGDRIIANIDTFVDAYLIPAPI